MNDSIRKTTNRILREKRTRSKIHGTKDRPRLCIVISNTNVSAQIINDEEHKTLLSASSIGKKQIGTMTKKAEFVGETIAKEALKKKIKAVVFDRGAKQYHGRIKSLADAARKNGLEF